LKKRWHFTGNLPAAQIDYLLNGSQSKYRVELFTPGTAIEQSVFAKITWRF
jgi:hypothetical protein